ncbi:MAG: molybdenum cofactor guanylyltransferase MobA [Kiloniellales bacterium]
MSVGDKVVGVVLAGGLARRMGGGDKCMLPLAGRPILAHILERFRPQVSATAINANGDPARFDAYGLPVLPDLLEGYQGPLAGVLTGLAWARDAHPDAIWMVTVPGDGPLLPLDLVSRFLERAAQEGADLACASSGERAHPVIGLWPLSLYDDLRKAVVEEEIRKVDRWTARHRLVEVAWANQPYDPFFNANRPEDLAVAEQVLSEA